MGDYSVGTQNPFNALEDEDTEPQAAGHEDDPARAQPKAHAKNATKTGQSELARRHPEKAAAVENQEAAQQKKHPKREFDRRSGTGRGREIPKGGRGGHNWGGADVPADNTEAVALDAAPKDEEAAAGAPAAGAAPAGAAAEPEKVDLGYEDFVAQMQQKKPPEDLELKARAVIVDTKQFKAGKVLEASEDEPLFADLVNKKEKAKKEKAKTKTTVSLDEFVVKHGGPLPRQEYRGDRDFEGGRGRGGRGRGRGGFRGGRGRGGFGGPAGAESADPAAAPAAAEAPAASPDASAPAAGAAPGGDQGFRGGRGGDQGYRGGYRGGRGRGSFRGNDSGFRGRGGFRGGRGGRGGHPGGESRAAPVDVSDDSLFPALKKA